MTRTRFHQGLDDLKQKLLAMGGMAEQAVERAVRAFDSRDIAVCELVLRDEAQINAAEREVDELSIDLLAMQQPMAVDLRFIIACIKINSDLERVGDQAVNIAERVMDMVTQPRSTLNVDIPRMASLTINMVRDALNAFLTANAELAQSVLERDDLVDNMNREIFEAADYAMTHQVEAHRDALDTLIIARNLERVADHATNIAEDVIFWVRGTDVRHRAEGQTLTGSS
jgi:phosphate transport system protein